MSDINEINALISKLKDEELEDGSVLIISVKPVERCGQNESAQLNMIAKGSKNALTQGIASAMLADSDTKKTYNRCNNACCSSTKLKEIILYITF